MSKPAAIASGTGAPLRICDLDVVFIDLVTSRHLLEQEEAATPRLSPGDRLRVERLGSDPERQWRWRTARIATRIVLERAAGPLMRGIDFEIAKGGRPGLGEGHPHFNVSHTGDAALIAVCRSSPVGVDIERDRTLSMTPERRRRIIGAAAGLSGELPRGEDDCSNDLDVLRSWVRLEAIAKARGSGIGVLLTEEGVVGGTGGAGSRSSPGAVAVVGLDVTPPYIAALAAERLPESIAIQRFPASSGELARFIAAREG